LYSVAAKLGNEKYPEIREYAVFKKKEFLSLDLTVPIVPGQSEYSMFGGLSIGADYLTSKIRMAAEDKDIVGIVIKISDLPNSISYVGLIQELRQELVRFKAKGKYLVVYVEGEISANTYYLISCADKIVMSKMGAIYALGKSLTVTRLTGLLEKLGLQADTIKSGEYKDALSPFNPEYSAKQREHIEQLIFDVNEQVMSEIRNARQLTTSNIAELNDGGIIPANQALSYGLIDEIAYADKLKEFCRKIAKLDYDPELINVTQLPAYELDQDLLPNFNTIAVVDIDGEIVTGKTKENFLFGGKTVGSDSVIEELKKIGERDYIKAVVLRINSPGGSALASDMIYEQVMKLKEKKKYIVASFGNVAASGGYYIAVAADRIVANRGKRTASICVIWQMIRGGKLFDNIGVKQETIKTGEHMDMDSFGKELTEREREMLFKYQNKIYEDFKLVVAKGRDIHIEDVEKLAQGKIYSGAKAKELKLVDDFGTFYDAIDKAKEGAEISGKAKIVRIFNAEDYGWLVARSRFASMLGLDSLNLKNMVKQNSFAEFQSFIY
jgi:protease-4